MTKIDIVRQTLQQLKKKGLLNEAKVKKYLKESNVNPIKEKLKNFANEFNLSLRDLVEEWKAVKENYNGNVDEYLEALRDSGDYDVFQKSY
ncbi:MAG: hypothetical protein ABIP51_01260 [Bacteroidia bacterium]